MKKTCLYHILGVEKGADSVTIKKAYRSLALKYHPDRSPVYLKEHHSKIFTEINEAYAVLIDKDKKATYDKYGVIDDGNTDIVTESGEEILSKFNSDFTTEEVHEEETVVLEENEVAPKSKAKKMKEWLFGQVSTMISICGACKGTGRIKEGQGFFTIEEDCSKCQGYGKIEVEIPYNYNPYHKISPKKEPVTQPFNSWGAE